jgi:enoyl-CoA hydratase/carnithine racemase
LLRARRPEHISYADNYDFTESFRMTASTILLAQEGPILWITLNRPDTLNAYTAQMGDELTAAFARADGDDSIHVVVITGSGRVFCAGADISDGAGSFDTSGGSGNKNFGSASGEDIQAPNFVSAMFNSRKPSIVAFNGSAVGVGLTIALPADIRIASSAARFGFVFARRGLVPEAGSAWFLPKLVGLAQALRWCMTGELFSAQEALDKGLVSELCEPAQLLDRARALAMEIARNSAPVSLALTRQLLWRFAGAPLPFELMKVDGRLSVERGPTADVHEGVSAFLQKRPPLFPGRTSTDMPASYPWWQD